MKTDQLMTIAFDNGAIDFFHKSGRGDLTQLFNLGNKYRVTNDLGVINQTRFMNTAKTKAFIDIICKKQGLTKDEVIYHNGKRGKASRTYANLHFLIYVASNLDINFEYEIIDTFIKGKILQYRDDGGNHFKALNIAIDAYLPDRKGRNNKGVYIQIAKKLRNKIFNEVEKPDSNIWNTEIATEDKQKLRSEYEDKLVTLLKMGVVTSYDHLKELIEKL